MLAPTVAILAPTSPTALGCPARLVLTGSERVALPAAPAALVCRYSTMDDGPAGSIETRPTSWPQQGQAPNRRVVDRLVGLLDAGGTWRPGTSSCPADFGGGTTW
jgi:hypothetical protein